SGTTESSALTLEPSSNGAAATAVSSTIGCSEKCHGAPALSRSSTTSRPASTAAPLGSPATTFSCGAVGRLASKACTSGSTFQPEPSLTSKSCSATTIASNPANATDVKFASENPAGNSSSWAQLLP